MPFSSLTVDNKIRVRFVQGEGEEYLIEITGQPDRREHVVTSVENDELTIKLTSSVHHDPFKPLHVAIHVPASPALRFEKVHVRSGGVVIEEVCDEFFNLENMHLIAEGSGSIVVKLAESQHINQITVRASDQGIVDLSGSCNQLVCRISDDSTLDAEDLDSSSVDATIFLGSGEATVSVSSNLKAHLEGGRLQYYGDPPAKNNHREW